MSMTSVNSRFVVLSIISAILRIVGWLTAAAGLVVAILAVNEHRGRWDASELVVLSPFIGAIILGFTVVAFGEVIGVLFAIEANTRSPKPVA